MDRTLARRRIDENALKLEDEWYSTIRIVGPVAGEMMLLKPDQHRDVYETPIGVAIEHLRRYRQRYWLLRARSWPRQIAVASLYVARNYVADRVLPVALAVLAAAAMYNVVNVSWVRALLRSHGNV